VAETSSAIDLSRPLSVHIVGIGGGAMSGIATVLKAMGHTVTGSDLKDSPGLDRLRALGIPAVVGHRAENIGAADLIAFSAAIPAHNPEMVAAAERHIPVYKRTEMLAAICATRQAVAVAGTHGKTTTASMLSLILIESGLRPSFMIGSEVNEVGTNALWSDSEVLVVEADESDGTFLELPRHAAVVNNVEPDHLDHYGGFDGLIAAFDRFLAETPGPKVVSADDRLASELGRKHGALAVGTDADADYQIVDVVPARSSVTFGLVHGGAKLGEVSLPAPGMYNVRNAAAAMVAALAVGASFDAGARALARYGGVHRRFEFRGERDGVTFVDDYAHLPSEVSAVLDAAKDGDWRRVVCVFQPHRYSRTASLWRNFADAFVDADLLVLTEIYGFGEAPRPGVSGRLVLQAILDAHPQQAVAYLPKREEIVSFLKERLRPGDLCLVLGAGDITSLPDELLGS
jgi:UDP-N-acetylmuramate--alanine ligase